MKDQISLKFLPNAIPTILMLIVFGISCSSSKNIQEMKLEELKTPFEKDENYSASYDEAIAFYQNLAIRNKNQQIHIREIGYSDSGKPLHAIIIGDDGILGRANRNKTVLMINNAIHPGEPCGIDASMILARDLLENEEKKKLLASTVVVIIPVYNISGSLNRGSYSRANQAGPKEYGFRGNIRNYDLNRDFIKCDTKNAQAFNQFYNQIDPDVFIDNHTSNGADYQYVITLIATQKDKLHPKLAHHLTEKMLPALYAEMADNKYEMTPYVYSRNTPDDGIAGFLDLPRYSSGFAALHHAYSFMPETHMLKPYKERVWSTYHFMNAMLNYLNKNGDAVRMSRKDAKEAVKSQKEFSLNWAIDMNKTEEINFKGYEAAYKLSKISGKKRLYYDLSKPFEKSIPFLNNYKVTDSVEAPSAYIIPKAFSAIIDRLKWNNVTMQYMEKDSVMDVEVYYIEDLETRDSPFEGHYLHSNVKVRTEQQKLKFYAGDVLVPVNQEKNRYIVEVLQPQGPDSFFAWNFMDGILMQKEYFSSYVFEETAEELLKNDDVLRKEFEKKKADDAEFAENGRAQLNFIYERSPYYEKSYKRYPIGMIK